ncbi:hypothetical protein, partial [Pseudomonas syringae]|uniref:hypothetical protein n=1 Tax=Pseudomonas syringae TaxID=317 RepID=UPI001F334C55
MKITYVLDTNAYALLFQFPRNEAYANLEKKLTTDNVWSFYIPEIVSMEIHSVLGKFRRGGAKEQRESCSKKVYISDEITDCGQVCYVAPRPRMKPKLF